MKILISACLLGVKCKYDGGSNEQTELRRLLEGHELHTVCPEMLGGLPSPRKPAELRNGLALCEDGASVDDAFRSGARAGLALARRLQPELVILKSLSPSCGSGAVYDGSFSHVKVPGDGIFAALLKAEGFRVLTGEEALSVLKCGTAKNAVPPKGDR